MFRFVVRSFPTNNHTKYTGNKKKTTIIISQQKTNWKLYKEIVKDQISCIIPLKTVEDVEIAVNKFNTLIQEAAWTATLKVESIGTQDVCSINLKIKIAEKRKLRKVWQATRSPHDKTKLNKAAKQLKQLINAEKNQAIEDYLKNLSATESLWKATKKIKNPQQSIPPLRLLDGKWARSSKDKANLFA